MSTADFIIICLGKLKENSLITEKKNENNIFKINILMEETLVVKEISNFKSNFNSNLKLKDENYSYYEKVKVAKLDKFYKK